MLFFKGQTTPIVTDLLRKYDCIIIHVSNNHANLFQPFDISVNKNAKYFVADKSIKAGTLMKYRID